METLQYCSSFKWLTTWKCIAVTYLIKISTICIAQKIYNLQLTKTKIRNFLWHKLTAWHHYTYFTETYCITFRFCFAHLHDYRGKVILEYVLWRAMLIGSYESKWLVMCCLFINWKDTEVVNCNEWNCTNSEKNQNFGKIKVVIYSKIWSIVTVSLSHMHTYVDHRIAVWIFSIVIDDSSTCLGLELHYI